MKINLASIEEAILPLVSKPNRYVGNLKNFPVKNEKDVVLRVLLAFPDVYEIGLSHLGLKILTNILSSREDTLCELAFAPWVDMEEAMRANGIPLFSLPGRKPMRSFDIVGFSLQYELQYTNVLNMLDMGNVPLLSEDRTGGDPIVIAGGPCAFNPEPMSSFIDCFVIGDGEDAIMELADVMADSKKRGAGRTETLRRLAGIEGVYVPLFYKRETTPRGTIVRRPAEAGIPERIRTRFSRRLPGQNYPGGPVVPLTEIAHDRFTLEVMRGCTRGCRFCMAGCINRPVREKSPEDVLKEARDGIDATGWSEISLCSLSSSDYSSLREILPLLRRTFLAKGLSISLPSMRPGTIDRNILKELSHVHRPGLTFAPEAGTDRLRKRINKPVSLESVIETVEFAKDEGFRSVKLYFMIGLPGEDFEDVDGIAEMAKACARAGRREKGGVRIKLSISPFVPKPHTPFQWEKMESIASLDEKVRRLRKSLKGAPVDFKWRSPGKSAVEAVFSRGDSSLGEAILSAWKRGAKFEGWTDFFSFDLWKEVLGPGILSEENGVGGFDPGDDLPWDHIQAPVSKEFLLRERQASIDGRLTGDCRTSGCTSCGIDDCPMTAGGQAWSASGTRQGGQVDILDGGAPPLRDETGEPGSSPARGVFGRIPKKERKERDSGATFRVRFSKGDQVRFLSHLDVMRVFDMAMRRSGLRPCLRGGDVQRTDISFGPPLPLGMTSVCEYFDISLANAYSGGDILRLNALLPDGFEILEAMELLDRRESLMSAITVAEYAVMFTDFLLEAAGNEPGADVVEKMSEGLVILKQGGELIIEGRKGPVDAGPAILSSGLAKTKDGRPMVALKVQLSAMSGVRPEMIVSTLAGNGFDWRLLKAERTGLWANRHGVALTPMELAAKSVRSDGA